MSLLPVSIIIPCHNADRHLEECLFSVVGQLCAEIILLDDNSSDRSVKIAENFSQVQVIRHVKRMGAQALRNEGIELSTQPYLHFMDADDYLLPHSLASLLTELRQNPPAKVVYGNYRVIPHCGRDRLPGMPYLADTGTCNGLLESLLRNEFPPTTPCFLFERSVFDRIRWDDSGRYALGLHDRRLALDLVLSRTRVEHVPTVVHAHRCGWSPYQISQSRDYLAHRVTFMEDSGRAVAGIQQVTQKRYVTDLMRDGDARC